MKKTVTVKRNQAHRIGIWLLSALILIGMGVLIVLSKQETAIVLCLIPVLILLPLLLYYKTWQLTFDHARIHKRVFWFHASSHSWHQIKEVRASWSYTEKSCIRILFTDGKSIRFRKKDSNAGKAMKWIQSHHSIQGESL